MHNYRFKLKYKYTSTPDYIFAVVQGARQRRGAGN